MGLFFLFDLFSTAFKRVHAEPGAGHPPPPKSAPLIISIRLSACIHSKFSFDESKTNLWLIRGIPSACHILCGQSEFYTNESAFNLWKIHKSTKSVLSLGSQSVWNRHQSKVQFQSVSIRFNPCFQLETNLCIHSEVNLKNATPIRILFE